MTATDIDWTMIPAPADDGKARHLMGRDLPDVTLPATTGTSVNLASLSGITVLFVYPRTGRPDRPVPDGWDMTPGAKGCTPQANSFRDRFDELRSNGVSHLFGLSIQDTAYQQEVSERLRLPYPLLSDAEGALRLALDLPVLEVHGETLLKRLTLIARDGEIVDVGYPVFPPDADVDRVIDWLARNA